MARLGIIAGSGNLPIIAAKEALKNGEDPLILSIQESGFESNEFNDRVIPFYITRIGEVFKICKKNQIDRIVLLGKINKDILLKSYRYDLKAITLLAKMVNRNDYSFFKILHEEFDKEKITIISQKTYLKSLLLKEGRYTKKKISKNALVDIQYGMDLALKFANMDVGQSVVVMNQMILAVEAIEGTDETVKRGGILSKNKGATLCKSSKVGQDERFDLPTVGLNTLQYMKEYHYSTLAFQAEETLIVNPNEFIQFAEKHKINIVGYNSNGDFSKINDEHRRIE